MKESTKAVLFGILGAYIGALIYTSIALFGYSKEKPHRIGVSWIFGVLSIIFFIIINNIITVSQYSAVLKYLLWILVAFGIWLIISEMLENKPK